MEAIDRKQIGKHLQMMRKRAGFKSARAFAESIGIEPTAYFEYEQGRSSFSFERAWQFADALGCTLDELGGRPTPKCHYSDPRQTALNGHYEHLNDASKTALVDFAKSYAADPERRMSKERQVPRDRTAMGA